MIRGKYTERCLFAEKVIYDKKKDTNHRKTAVINKKKSTITGKQLAIPAHRKYIIIDEKKKKNNMWTQGNNYNNRYSVVNMS